MLQFSATVSRRAGVHGGVSYHLPGDINEVATAKFMGFTSACQAAEAIALKEDL